MNIQDQSINAIDFTQKLAKYIVNANTKTLNKDDTGCWVTGINIYYHTDDTTVTVDFASNDANIKTFTCKYKL